DPARPPPALVTQSYVGNAAQTLRVLQRQRHHTSRRLRLNHPSEVLDAGDRCSVDACDLEARCGEPFAQWPVATDTLDQYPAASTESEAARQIGGQIDQGGPDPIFQSGLPHGGWFRDA